MMIDIHTHVCSEKIWQEYQKKSGNKISKIIAIPYFNETSQDIPRVPDIEELLKFTSKEPNIYTLGSIDMDENVNNQLTRHEELFKEKKIVGIKLYTGYQHFFPYDDRVVQIAKLCEKYDKPLIFHTGDLFDPTDCAVLKYAHPIHINELARRCPNTKIVISHFGFPYFLETANVIASSENIYVDISSVMVKLDTKKETKILQKQYIKDLERVFAYYPFMKEKIMFGTDFAGEEASLCLIEPYIKVIKKLLNKDQQKNAFYKLAEELYFN